MDLQALALAELALLGRLLHDLVFSVLVTKIRAVYDDGKNILHGIQFHGLFHSEVQNLGDFIGFRGFVKGGENRAEQEHRHHYGHHRCRSEKYRSSLPLFARRFIVIIIIPAAFPHRFPLPDSPASGTVSRYPDQTGGFVGLLWPQVNQIDIQRHLRIFPERLQIGNHGVCRRIPLLQFRGHGLHADQLQLLRNIRPDLPGCQGDRA